MKPHEIARLRRESQQNGNGSDIELSDFDMDNVDDLLGITEPIPVSKTSKSKRNKVKDNINNNSLMKEGVDGVILPDNDLLVVQSRKPRYKSTGSNSDTLWQTKLINSNSLLSNLENTLQSIDTLVVGSSVGGVTHLDAEERKSKYKTGSEISTGGGSQRTQEVQINKNYNANKSRKRTTEKTSTSKVTRPRMIHTEKLSSTYNEYGRKRSKTVITHREQNGLDLLRSTGRSMVDDYEILSPATELPRQISSSPPRIKEEIGQNNHEETSHQQRGLQYDTHVSNSSRNVDLYDTQFLDAASMLRKEAYEKFNPSIVNDLEEILRSPIKCDRAERHRFISESSTPFLEDEQHNMIKIEPTSPDLREIVVGVSGSAGVSASGGSGSSNERRYARSARNRIGTINRKYLEFESELQTNGSTRHQKRSATTVNGSSTKSKQSKNNRREKKEISVINQRTTTYSSTYGGSLSTTNDSSFSSLSPTDGVNAISAVAATSQTAPTQPERKVRYFECEMCSAVFPDRAQLLDHVPIHI